MVEADRPVSDIAHSPVTCRHKQIAAQLQSFEVTSSSDPNPDNPVILDRVIEVQFKCQDCGCDFVFDWQDIADPNHPPSFTDKRPWTTPNRDTLCAKIKEADRQEDPKQWLREIDASTRPN